MAGARQSVRYSITVPLFNEQESIGPLYERLKQVMEHVGRPFECVFVDDSSTDGSLALLREIAHRDNRISVVGLPRNSGKSVALCAAFGVARGDFVITMDGDLQHDPADIPKFVAKLEEGFDIVCGRRTRRSEGWLQRLSTWSANWVLGKLTGIHIHDWGGGFKAYKRELVSELPIYGELQRLIPVLALRRGARVCEVPITAAPREHGVSKYGIVRKLPVFFDLITVRFLLRYLNRPLHFFGSLGLFSLAAGIATGLWLAVQRLAYGTRIMAEHGPLMIFSAVLIVAGIQLLALGLLAELLVRYFYESRGRSLLYEGASILLAQSETERQTGNSF